MKKTLILILTIMFIISVPIMVYAESTRPAMSVAQVDVGESDVVRVPITIANNSGICGATIIISYSEGLKLTGITNGRAFSTLSMTKTGDLSANPITILWDGTDAVYDNGEIAVLSFEKPHVDGKYDISLTYKAGDIIDDKLNPIAVDVRNGYISTNAAATATVGATPTATATSGVEPTATATAGVTPTATATSGAEPTATATVGVTPTATATSGAEPTATATAGVTPTATPTSGAEPTATPTSTDDGLTKVQAARLSGLSSSNDTLAVSGENIKKLRFMFDTVTPLSGGEYTATVIKGSKISFEMKGNVSATSGLKIKKDKTGMYVMTAKSSGTMDISFEDGSKCSVKIVVEVPKFQKQYKVVTLVNEKIKYDIKELLGTNIDSGDFYLLKEKEPGQAKIDSDNNTLTIEPKLKDTIKLRYVYKNKKYNFTIKVQ